MDRLSGVILVRGIELLLATTLFKAYGTATCAADLWTKFANAAELNQIGTVTAIVLIGRTVAVGASDVGARLMQVGGKLRARLKKAGQTDASSLNPVAK